jgi:polysaccharide chain length determinant protein (PEP-CTERM system associated)
VSAATAIYARRLPDVYRSEALIAVQAPRVQESVVRQGQVSMPKLEDRLPEIRNKVLARTRLERIITDLNLYPDERRTGIMEDIVDGMRSNVRVDAHSGSAIRVSFDGRDARLVQRVADRLTNFLIDESTRNRRTLVEGTNQFLDSSLKATQDRLVEKETALAKYRREHDGELPDQMNANLQAAQNQQMQIQALVSQRNAFEERRLQIEKAIQELESQAVNEVPELQPGQTGTTAQQLNAARQRLADLELTRTSAHPDVQQVRRVIQELQAKLEREATESPVGSRSVSPAEAARLKRLQENRDLLAQLDRQMKTLETELGNARQRAQEFLRRADAAPMRQTDMTSLTRDYNTISQVYTTLAASKEQASIAADLERREIGETFELIDPPRVPSRPYSPNRTRLNLIGMTIGLAFGVGLVALLEYRDSAFKTDEDLARVLGMPVLAVVPLMQSDQERRRTFQRRIAVGTVLGGTVLACLAVVAYTFVY